MPWLKGGPPGIKPFRAVCLRVRSLEEPHCLRRIADKDVLGLKVVVKHHLMGFATKAGFLVTAEGRVRLTVSRIGLPLSIVSISARKSRFSWSRSAMRLRISERSATEVRPQLWRAACAASSASSMSGAVDLATSQTGFDVIGVDVRKVAAFHGRNPFPADEVVVLLLHGQFLIKFGQRFMNHWICPPPYC